MKEAYGTLPAAGLDEALERYLSFQAKLQSLIDAGITPRMLANSLGVNEVSLWRWRRGGSFPKEPLVFLVVLGWAAKLESDPAERQRILKRSHSRQAKERAAMCKVGKGGEAHEKTL